MQLACERRTDPRLLKRILAHVEAIPHIKVDPNGGMVDRLDELGELIWLIPADMLKRQRHAGRRRHIRDRAQCLRIDIGVGVDTSALLMGRKQNSIRANRRRKIHKGANMLENHGPLIRRKRRKAAEVAQAGRANGEPALLDRRFVHIGRLWP